MTRVWYVQWTLLFTILLYPLQVVVFSAIESLELPGYLAAPMREFCKKQCALSFQSRSRWPVSGLEASNQSSTVLGIRLTDEGEEVVKPGSRST